MSYCHHINCIFGGNKNIFITYIIYAHILYIKHIRVNQKKNISRFASSDFMWTTQFLCIFFSFFYGLSFFFGPPKIYIYSINSYIIIYINHILYGLIYSIKISGNFNKNNCRQLLLFFLIYIYITKMLFRYWFLVSPHVHVHFKLGPPCVTVSIFHKL